jgi:MGT family glycosyltransferase
MRHVDEARVTSVIFAIGGLGVAGSQALRLRALMREWLVGTVPSQLADLEPVLTTWSPDVIVCDPAMWGPILILADTRGVPVAVFSYVAACMLPGQEGPVLGFSLPRPRTWRGKLYGQLVRTVAKHLPTDLPRAADRLRQEYRLSPLRTTVTEFAGTMPLYLVPSAPEYDYERRDLPPTVRYVGPCLWDKPQGEPPPPWLEQLPPDRPVVYVTEGTTHVRRPFVLRAAIEGLADLPVQVVVTTGRHREPAALELGVIPRNVRVERWMPQSHLLPRTSVVVTTGGSGNVLASLRLGIPLVIVPTSWDQPENAWRVAEAGAGLRLAPNRCTPDGLRAAVERVLGEPSFRENAGRLASVFARYGGGAQAAELLEALARRAGASGT